MGWLKVNSWHGRYLSLSKAQASDSIQRFNTALRLAQQPFEGLENYIKKTSLHSNKATSLYLLTKACML